MAALARKQSDNFRENLATLCAGYGAVSNLARHLDLHRVTMSKLVHGHIPLELDQAEAIARYYGLSLGDMLRAPSEFKKLSSAS